jgi:hypothetical protein
MDTWGYETTGFCATLSRVLLLAWNAVPGLLVKHSFMPWICSSASNGRERLRVDGLFRPTVVAVVVVGAN